MKKLTNIILPTSFRLVVNSPATDENLAKRRIKENEGKIVLLKDEHHSTEGIEYLLGRIIIDKKNEETYSFQLLNQKEPKRMHYHNLQGLLVPSGLSSMRVKVL